MKYTHCGKLRYLEPEYYTKYPEKKAAFDKMIAKKKAAKKQQALLKATPTAFVATASTIPTLTLLLSATYKFGDGASRMFIAIVLPLSTVYTFGKTVYTNMADIDKA